MLRNKQTFYYALYEDKVAKKDDYGNFTGDYDIIYGEPQEYYANISAANGNTAMQQFGESEDYDKVIVMDNDAPLIDEYTVLWIDTVPEYPYDYVVKKVARSLNGVSVAISKVKVS